jgi:hypothetical protein
MQTLRPQVFDLRGCLRETELRIILMGPIRQGSAPLSAGAPSSGTPGTSYQQPKGERQANHQAGRRTRRRLARPASVCLEEVSAQLVIVDPAGSRRFAEVRDARSELGRTGGRL